MGRARHCSTEQREVIKKLLSERNAIYKEAFGRFKWNNIKVKKFIAGS